MIDQKEQESLRIKFNPEGSILRQQQLRMLDMLVLFDKICRENAIMYWLDFGTLLGAVRHGGFIPWDDDLDVSVRREDYARLKIIMQKEYDNIFFFQDAVTEPTYVRRYAKLRDLNSCLKEVGIGHDNNYKYKGVYMDLFFLEKSTPCLSYLGMRATNLAMKANVKFYNTNLRFVFFLYKKLLLILLFVFKLLSEIVGRKHFLGYPIGAGIPKQFVAIDSIYPLKEIQFEGNMFFIPNDTDRYLRCLYGDYTLLPDLDTVQDRHLSWIELFDKNEI